MQVETCSRHLHLAQVQVSACSLKIKVGFKYPLRLHSRSLAPLTSSRYWYGSAKDNL